MMRSIHVMPLAAALLASLIGAPVRAATADPALPAPIEKLVAGYADQCRRLGGTLAAGTERPWIMTADLDGDGRPDYVLNPQNMRCSAAATAYCGNGGCQITVALSSKDYQEPLTVLGGQPTLSQKQAGTAVEIWVSRSSCDLTDPKKACWAIYTWKDGKLRPTYQVRSQS